MFESCATAEGAVDRTRALPRPSSVAASNIPPHNAANLIDPVFIDSILSFIVLQPLRSYSGQRISRLLPLLHFRWRIANKLVDPLDEVLHIRSVRMTFIVLAPGELAIQ